MKRANIDGENLHIFWTTWGILMMTFRKDVTYDNIKIKFKKKQQKKGPHSLSEKYIFEKTQVRMSN